MPFLIYANKAAARLYQQLQLSLQLARKLFLLRDTTYGNSQWLTYSSIALTCLLALGTLTPRSRTRSQVGRNGTPCKLSPIFLLNLSLSPLSLLGLLATTASDHRGFYIVLFFFFLKGLEVSRCYDIHPVF